MISPERIAKFESEKKTFHESEEGKVFINDFRDKLNKTFLSTVELPLDADEDDWIEKAAEYLSPIEFKEFVENFLIGGIESIVYLRTKIRQSKKKNAKMRQMEAKPEKPKPPKPRAHVQNRIKELRDLKKEAINNRSIIPKWSDACGLIGIDPRTVQKYAFDLYENWYIWEF